MTREFPKRRYVLAVAFVATIIATFFSFSYFPVLILIWVLYEVPSTAAAMILFAFTYFAICSALSIGLFARLTHAWGVSAAVFVALVLGNVVYFGLYWNMGIEWQGSTYTWLMLCSNLFVGLLAALLLVASKHNPGRPWQLLAAHASVLFWLTWNSFPGFGEGPRFF